MRDDDIPEVRPIRPRRRHPTYEDESVYDQLSQDAGMRMLLPVGRSGWAIAAGYLGLISVLLIPAPFAIVAAVLAILDIKRNPKKHGMGRAIFGLVMGILCTIPLVIWLIALVAIALER